MSILLSSIIDSVRAEHPAFDDKKVGDGLIAQWMTRYQRRLFQKALAYNRHMYATSLMISLVPSDDNTAPYSGAGQEGELPAASASGVATVDPLESTAGKAVTVVEGTVAVSERVATSGTTTSLTKTGSGWTVNQFADDYIVKIVRGSGAGQQRQIVSNTSDTIVFDELATAPDSTSIFRISAYTLQADEGHLVVADFPMQEDSLGYVVKTDASGNPYIDWTVPIVGKRQQGIPLPQMNTVLGGTVYFDDGETDPLTIVGYKARYRAPGDYPAYISNNELFLIGLIETWEEIAQIELRYVPIPPALTARTSTLLLPDSARDALIGYASLKAALRCRALGVDVDSSALSQEYAVAENEFLQTLSFQRKARFSVIRG